MVLGDTKQMMNTVRRLLWVTYIILFASSDCDGFLFTFSIRPNKTFSDILKEQDYASHFVRRKTECSRLCSEDIPNCRAFYIDESPWSVLDNNGKWKCMLISERVKDEFINTGSGTYGFLEEIESRRIINEPDLTNGVLVRFDEGPHGFTGVYDCRNASQKITTVSLLFNDELNKWPSLNTLCSDRLCNVTGFSNTVLRIEEKEEETPHSSSDYYTVYTMCAENETHYSDAVCDRNTGAWSFSTGTLNIGCISTTCARYNGEKALYAGTMSQTLQGITCQRWDAQSPNSHDKEDSSFDMDDYDLSNADNFCRDPDNHGHAWCYQLTGDRWENCDVPFC